MTFPSSSAVAVLVFALWAAPSEAAVQTFGSDLTGEATIAEARQSDTAYWQTVAAGQSTTAAAPADGSIRSFKVKGIAMSRPQAGRIGGETLFHLQALRPIVSGPIETWKYRVLITSQGFEMPSIGTDPQTTTTFAPENFCVAKGDVMAFNTVGGWDGTADGPYAGGTPLQIFARTPGALVSQFNGAGQTNNGDILTPDNARGAGEELLMQMTLATGADANPLCGTSAPPPPPPPPPPSGPGSMTAPRAKITSGRVTVTRKGGLSVALFCSAGSGGGPCKGTVRVLSRDAPPRVLASHGYSIVPARTGKVALVLSASGRRAFAKAHGRLRVSIQTVTKPGGAASTVTKSFTLRRRG